MPQNPVVSNERLSLRIDAADKRLLMRAASLQSTDLTEFVTRTAISAAKTVIEQHENVALSGKDSLHVLLLLEDPPLPNKKLMAAAFALRDQS